MHDCCLNLFPSSLSSPSLVLPRSQRYTSTAMVHPLIHGLFHSIASLGYIPFALTSVLFSTSTPFLAITPINIILLAFVPPLTMFPILCFSYRYLDRFDAVSLSVQRARIYIMLAGSGLCCLVAAQLLMTHVVNNSHNSAYNRMAHSLPPPQQLYSSLPERNMNVTSDPNLHLAISLSAPILAPDQIPNATSEKIHGATLLSDPSVASIDQAKIEGIQDQASTRQPSDNQEMISPASSSKPRRTKRDDGGQVTAVRDSDKRKTGVSTDENKPKEREQAATSPRHNLEGVHSLLFIAGQILLICFLGVLFLGVLIMTEFVLDKEDDDDSRSRSYFWGRVVGIGLATVTSALHGSFLTGYVLLDGQSDWIAKAAVGTILLYWSLMSWTMNKLTHPLPY